MILVGTLPPMASLLETLQLIHPAIASEAAAEFRTALVAILQQLEQDETAANRSLQGWWTWLDEEGYDRDGFGLILNQVCEAKLGEQGGTELRAFLQASAAEPEGLPKLIDHVQSEVPDLAQTIESLEALAVEEEQQLVATAGGMSKGATIGVAVGSTVAVLGISGVGYAIYRRNKTRAANEARERADQMLTVEKENAAAALRKEARMGVRVEREDATLESVAHDFEALKKVMMDPSAVVNLGKGLEKYEDNDIETHVAQLVGKHTMIFAKEIDVEIKAAIADKLRDNPEYQKQVLQETDQLIDTEAEKLDFMDLGAEIKNSDIYQTAIAKVENGSWFKGKLAELETTDMSKLRKEIVSELTQSYKPLVKEEVAIAKREALNDADNEMINMVSDGKGLAKKSEIRVQLEVRGAARDAKATAERDSAEIIDELDIFSDI
jgi:hypothetical protein